MKEKIIEQNLILVGVVFTVLVISYTYFMSVHSRFRSITSFDECVKAGFQILTTYPEKCVLPGKVFTNPLQHEEKITRELLTSTTSTITSDYKNLSYMIEGQEVILKNGIGILGSNQLVNRPTSTIEIAGNAVSLDINNDSRSDIVFLLHTVGNKKSKDTFYVSGVLTLHNNSTGLNAVYLGDTLKDAALTLKNGEIAVTYTSLGVASSTVVKYFIVSDALLKEVVH